MLPLIGGLTVTLVIVCGLIFIVNYLEKSGKSK